MKVPAFQKMNKTSTSFKCTILMLIYSGQQTLNYSRFSIKKIKRKTPHFKRYFHHYHFTLALLFGFCNYKTIGFNKRPMQSVGEQNGLIKDIRYYIFS